MGEPWGCAWPALPGVLGAGRPAGPKHHRLHTDEGRGGGGGGRRAARPHGALGTIPHSRLGAGWGEEGRVPSRDSWPEAGRSQSQPSTPLQTPL